MTFWKYITRPSGFGRMEWSFWACMVGIMLYGAVLVFLDFDKATAIVVGICFALTTAIVIGGTIKNFREDQRDLSNPNHHMNDVRHEGEPLPTMKDGSPIMDPVKWYQARYEVSREMATRAMKYESAQHEYRVYLSNPKFNRFK